ncbi:MAG TPA: hypothetical protein VJR02_19835 [Pyrinomonadaceae bacterium]|nr:hypothetical protein [Pyrinomonadaceae bacterium]
MTDKEIKSWLDIAPAYLNFAIRFLRWERTAFASVAKAGEVSRDLTSILLGGVALSYLIAFVAAPAQLEQDPSRLVQWLSKVEYHLLPLIGLFATLVLAIATHLLGKLFARFSAFSRSQSGRWDPRLGGTLEDSVNSALGFAAVFLPTATTALCIMNWLPLRLWIPGVTGIILAFLFVAYFTFSLSSTHPDTGYFQAFLALWGAIAVFCLALYFIVWLASPV